MYIFYENILTYKSKFLFYLKITGPDGKVIHQGERESNGKYTFAAHTDGVYSYCFSNAMSTMTPKIVMFSMDVGEAPKSPEADADSKILSYFLLYFLEF